MKGRKFKKVILYALVFTLGLAAEQAKADLTISEPTSLGPIIILKGWQVDKIVSPSLCLLRWHFDNI